MIYETFVRESSEFLSDELGLERADAHSRARLLLDGLTGTRYSHLIAPDAILDAAQLQTLKSWLQDAARGRPIPYILGRAPFFGLEFEVDERVLIPRPETELLVETALQKLQLKAAPRVADLGTGSGAIAVSLAKNCAESRIWASDVSPGALEIARRNAQSNGVAIQFLRGEASWLAPIEPFAPFDAIVSNPPYIAAREIETLEIGVRDFEPRLALDGGVDGLDPYREIAFGVARLLANDGFVALEIGAGQWRAIEAIFLARGWEVEAPRCDLAGIERVLVASKSRSAPTTQSDLKSQPTERSAFADNVTATLSAKADLFVGCDFRSLWVVKGARFAVSPRRYETILFRAADDN